MKSSDDRMPEMGRINEIGQFSEMWHQVAGHKDHGNAPGNLEILHQINDNNQLYLCGKCEICS